jgi:hypothetical protein
MYNKLLVAALALSLAPACAGKHGPGSNGGKNDDNCDPTVDSTCAPTCDPSCDPSVDENCDPTCADPGDDAAFPDSDGKLPSGWNGPVFKLAQSYPSTLPTHGPGAWASVDFTSDPDGYAMAVRDYLYQGLGVDGDNTVELKPKGFYSMPWMHTGANPREAIHGLTREVDENEGRLNHSSSTAKGQSWGVGFYNDIGGYTIGQVWKNHNLVDPSKSQFPEGTVVMKALFSSFTSDDVPQLAGAFQWDAYINSTITHSSPKAVQKVSLMQMDFAVKDSRAGTSGWVFGTFVYDPNAQGDSGWDKMMPLGVAWGNDLSQTAIARTAPGWSRDLVGYQGRLNGPADNPISACMSCHGTSEYSPTQNPASLVPTGADVSRWFRTLAPNEPFDGDGFLALDYSLQMEIAFRNYKAAGGKFTQ